MGTGQDGMGTGQDRMGTRQVRSRKDGTRKDGTGAPPRTPAWEVVPGIAPSPFPPSPRRPLFTWAGGWRRRRRRGRAGGRGEAAGGREPPRSHQLFPALSRRQRPPEPEPGPAAPRAAPAWSTSWCRPRRCPPCSTSGNPRRRSSAGSAGGGAGETLVVGGGSPAWRGKS